jgi:hypothetical protein
LAEEKAFIEEARRATAERQAAELEGVTAELKALTAERAEAQRAALGDWMEKAETIVLLHEAKKLLEEVSK